MLVPLVYVLAFIAVVLLVQAAGSYLFSERDRAKRLNRRMTMLDSGMSQDAVYGRLIRQAGGNPAPLGLGNLEDRLSRYLQQTDLQISARRFLLVMVAIAGALWVIGLLVSRGPGPLILLNALASLIAAVAIASLGAWLFISSKREKRLRLIEEQLPLALDIMNRALRAGHPVISAVQLAAREMGDPIGTEFGLIVDETTYGVEFPEALHNFARRTGSSDASFFAVSVSIQSQTGGNLAEILDGLATVVRGRHTLKKRVKALASEGKATAVLLSSLPILMIGTMLLLQPLFYTSKFSDPIFWPVVAIVVLDYIIGLFVIRRIINFKY